MTLSASSKIKAVFIGFQEDKDGNHIPLFNVGKYTHTATTLTRRGIAIPEIPTIRDLEKPKLQKGTG